MKRVFADTFFWTALANPRDSRHHPARLYESQTQIQFVTTDEVLVEFLNFFSSFGHYTRHGISERVHAILNDESVQVITQSHESFLTGLALYSQRLDKGYSLTDCISMNTMKQLEITEVLTHDKHFTQEGFVILFSD